ncbi:hypothetical protein [Pseudidiomarina donghaiensis]|uniref:hypothetical protein n=1 Tax=Pseudidiomarina donghaiensis TaxID=519452 RepID=UPI003A9779EC
MQAKSIVPWLIVATCLVLFVSTARAQLPDYFTDSSSKEYREVLYHLQALLPPDAVLKDNPLAYSFFITPYAQLDVRPTKFTNPEHRAEFANFNFGAIGAMYTGTPQYIKNLAAAVLCRNDDCHQDKAEHVAAFIQVADQELKLLAKSEQLSIVQQSNDQLFRINNAFFVGPSVTVYEPSAVAGFVPSARTTQFERIEQAPSEIAQLRALSMPLRKLMASHKIAAIERHNNGALNIIVAGFADNQYGAVWKESGLTLPSKGDKNWAGFEYQELLPISAKAFYYQTN